MEFKISKIEDSNYVISTNELGNVAKVNETADEWILKVKYPIGFEMDMTLFKSRFETIEEINDFVANEVGTMYSKMNQ